MGFAENILKYRKIKGYTQDDIAEKLGVSRQSVSKWENGESVPDMTRTVELADILEVGMDTLFDREDVVKTEQNIVTTQDIKIGFKHSLLVYIIIGLIIAAIGITVGIIVGKDNIFHAPEKIMKENQVSGINAVVDDHRQVILNFVLSNYDESYSYMVYATSQNDGGVNPSKVKGNVEFYNGSCRSVLNLMDCYDYKIVLEVGYNGETKYYTLANSLFRNGNEVFWE